MERILNEQQLEEVYNWVDQIPLSRPKRNMQRDFSDGVLTAEILAHYYPNLVELHNFISTGSLQQKINNWNTLNQKVLKKLKIHLKKQQVESIAGAQPLYIERLILMIRKAVQNGQMVSPTMVSKSNTKFSFQSKLSNKVKPLTWKDIQKKTEVKELISYKDAQIQQLKKLIQLQAYKHSKLQEILKSKDHQISQLVNKIKVKGLT